jgi:hypothetical protein
MYNRLPYRLLNRAALMKMSPEVLQQCSTDIQLHLENCQRGLEIHVIFKSCHNLLEQFQEIKTNITRGKGNLFVTALKKLLNFNIKKLIILKTWGGSSPNYSINPYHTQCISIKETVSITI